MGYTKRQQRSIILAINIGNTLEWYELALYAYWAPILADIFFDHNSPTSNLINVFLILALGYLIRPLGGLFFGRLGDRIGRRKALLWSIFAISIPAVGMAFLPSYSSIGILAPILLCIMRLLQSFPAGGELPGSFCYLYESAQPSNRKYLTSWGFVGNQLGFIVALVECLFFEKFLSHEDLVIWGWRLSFLLGGLIGIYGFYLRCTLKETPFWEKLEQTHKVVSSPIKEVFLAYKWKIAKGIGYSAITSSSFAALSAFFPLYFDALFGTDHSINLMLSIAVLVLVTLPLPFFGKLADKYNYKTILIFCSVLILLLLMVLRLLPMGSLYALSICICLTLSFACLYAILPFILTDLFPTQLRYTGIAITYNLADSIGSLTPVAGIYLLQFAGNQMIYFWILALCTLISLGFYMAIKVGRTTSK